MSILKRLFGPKEPPPPPRDVMALAAPLATPALHLVKAAGESTSYLGGMPPWPADTPWPARDGAPLTFLACIDLAVVEAALPVPWLPATGRLLFFYDAEKQPWGFDPKDRGSWVLTVAAEGVRFHITRFWDPRMRREIIAHVDAGGAGLTPTARSAVLLLSNSPNQSK